MNHIYEYATIRYIPDVERNECLNIGLIMMCKRCRWIRVAFEVNECRILAIDPDCDTEILKNQLRLFSEIAAGNKSYGPVALLEPEERFRWLTAVKSSCIQTSRPHPGLTQDLDSTFECVFNRMVSVRKPVEH